MQKWEGASEIYKKGSILFLASSLIVISLVVFGEEIKQFHKCGNLYLFQAFGLIGLIAIYYNFRFTKRYGEEFAKRFSDVFGVPYKLHKFLMHTVNYLALLIIVVWNILVALDIKECIDGMVKENSRKVEICKCVA